MLPRLSTEPQLSSETQQFVKELSHQHFLGDIETSYAARLSMATDNSIYQQLPQAILYPKENADIVRILKLSQLDKYSGLRLTPRGGGTGTNGQSLNNTIIIDMSRHMTNIIELNVEERWVRVQAGVVKDQLNQFLKPHGLFFAPDLSTSNRATIGGMINTDASGQGSLQYGKTSDHVIELTSILYNGEVLETFPIHCQELDEVLSDNSQTKLTKNLHKTIYQRCFDKRDTILSELPDLNRFITGYDLKNVFDDDLKTFNLSRILTGSEGSLALITEAKLDLNVIPQYRSLINIQYRSFDSALRNAPFLVQANALSVETIDSKVLNLAKEDIIWHSVSELLIEDIHTPMLGLNIVEFAGNNKKHIEQQIQQLCSQLDDKIKNQESDIIRYQRCDDLNEIERIYSMRKKSVGLLGNSNSQAKPLPFVEDTCVPPEHLADYIQEFRALLDKHNLDYGMFGHVDAGVLHVRPALDLCERSHVELLKVISDQVVELTKKYGGLIWGEHGKGIRSAYAEKFFGEKLWPEIRYIKTLFDPENRFNPGKICTPLESSEQLMPIESTLRADYDREIPIKVRETFSGAMNCNGNGLCFNFDVDSAICPSMKVSRDRIQSPKGRAALMREWLRLMTLNGVKPEELNFNHKSNFSLTDLVKRVKNSWRMQHEYDFSHEVKKAMDTCLACKACASQCPIKIDVPNFRTQFNHYYHQRYLRPIKDHIVANVEFVAPLLAKYPQLSNIFTDNKFSAQVIEHLTGLVDLPSLSQPTLMQQLEKSGYEPMTLERLEQVGTIPRKNMLLIVQDPFTSFYDAKVVADFIKLCLKLNLAPVLLPFKPNGKAQHIKGFLTRFAKTAQNQADFLNRIAKLDIPMVGLDPAIVLSYRDEYRQVLGEKSGNFKVLTTDEWLSDALTTKNVSEALAHNSKIQQQISLEEKLPWYLFSHCTEATAMPQSKNRWQKIFKQFGQHLETVSTGCCGMAGTFGHEIKHKDMSQAIYQQSWQRQLSKNSLERSLATGYSCRSQVKRMEKEKVLHPVQALLSLFN